MEVAALGLRIDSDPVDKAASDLDRLTHAAGRAERAATDLRKGGDAATRAMNSMDAAARKSSVAMANLAQVAARAGVMLGAALSVRALQLYADSWSDMQSRVGAAVKNMEAAPALMRRIVDIANASYSPLAQTVEIYSRNVAVLRQMGKSAAEAADFTESLNHMLVITATRGERATAVQDALSKAMAVGKLQADGLETVLANGGRVAEALAEALGTNVNGLRSMASQGKITADVIAAALLGSLERVRKEAAGMPATIADAFTRVQTNITELVGRLDKAAGASSAIAEHILGFADSIRTVGDFLIGFGQYAAPAFDAVGKAVAAVAGHADVAVVALAGFYSPAMIAGIALLTKSLAVGLVGAIRAVTAALMANPVGMVVGALAAAGYAAYKFRDQIQEAIGVDVVDVFKRSANFLIASFVIAYEQMKFVFGNLGGIVGGAVIGSVNVAIRAINTLTQAATGAIDGLIALINTIPGVDPIAPLGDALRIDEFANPFADRLSEGMARLKRRIDEIAGTDYLGALGEAISNAFSPAPVEEFMDALGGGKGGAGGVSKELQKWLNDMRVSTATARTMTEAYLAGGDAISQLTRQAEIEAKVLEHGAKARDAITAAIHAQAAAQDRLDIAKQIDDLRRQAQAGTQYVAVLAAQSKGYTAGRAALTAYNREQARAELLVGKTAAEVADLRDVYGQLWDRLESTNIQREAMEELNGLVESTATRQERYNRELEKLLALAPYAQTEEQARALQRAIEDLNRENSVWFEFTQDAIERINEAFADMWRDAFDGSRSAFDGMKRAFRQMLAEMAHAAITRPIVISLGNAIMGTNTPGGIGDVWGGGNRVLGTAQNLYSGYNAVSGGLSNTLGNAAQWLGQKVGSEALTSFGLGLSGTTAATGIASIGAGLGASLGTSIGTSAAAMTTTSFSAALSGGALVPGLGVGAAGGGVGAGIGAAGAAGGAAAGGAAGIGSAIGAALPWIGGALAIGSLLGGGLFDREPTTRREQRTQVEYSGGALGVTSRDDRVQAGTDAAVAQMTAAAIESANSLFRQIGIDAAIDSFHAIMASSYQGDRDGVASGGRLRIGDRLVDIGIPDDENPTIKGFGGWSSAETLPRLATDIQLTVLEAFQAASDQLPSVLATMLADVDVRSLGEAEAQALAERFTALTQGAAAFLSTLEQTPFAELRDLSFDAAAAMVQFAGSVDNLLSAQQTYYDRYYSEQEKFEHSVNQLSQALSGVGVVMPELTGSTDDMLASYRRLVESLDLNTEAGQHAYVVLMQSAGAFADVAQYAGQAASAVEGASRSLADIARERESLERQLLQLQGDTAELRRRELEALDESNHALQRYIWALQDQRSAWDAAVAAGESAFSALSRSVAAEKTRLQKESQAIADALRNSISAASTTVNELTSLTGRLTSTVQRMIGQGLDEGRNRAWAQDRIDRALSVAKLTGVMPQGADFEQALQIVAQPSDGLFQSFEDYQADFLKTAHTVSELSELADGQLSIEKRALRTLEDQLQQSQNWYQAEMERLDALLEAERQRLDVAMGTYETLLTIPEALAGIQSAIANIQLIVPPAASGGGGGSGASWDDLYLSAKLAELQNKGAVSHGIDWQSGTINDLAAVFASEGLTPELHYQLYGKDEGIDEWMKRLPGFAVGTNYVPYDMVARIHEGERIIPATDNRELMQMLARGVDRDNTNRLLQQEIRELRLMMERKLDESNRNTGDTARTNRQMVEQRQIVQVEGPVATVLVEDRTA